ncbi:stalk domain-containing protein [Desulforamulus putei]|uniref:stalk domain-containing protein n=1 Tax=Desulforamulus putei TaxID=74701 RepID=UPI002FDED643
MKIKVLAFLSILTVFFTFSKPATAAQVVIDGKPMEAPVMLENGTTLVPLRAIFETLNAIVRWEPADKTITAVKDDVTIVLQIGSTSAYRNGERVSLQVPGKIVNNTTMVPLRFVSESLGAEVHWIDSTQTVVINSAPAQQETALIIHDSYKVLENSDPLYNQILKGLREAEEKVEFTSTDQGKYGDTEKILSVVQQVLQDHPFLNYIESLEVKIRSGSVVFVEIRFQYYFPAREVKEMIQAVEQKSVEIIKKVIKPGMTDLEKEKALHDYIVLNTRYDYENYQKDKIPKESYTAYGVLVKGVGVCQGYASAMSKLLNMVGIENHFIIGTGRGSRGTEAHGWNKVKIDGRWYHLDTTWDDPAPDQPGRISYKYFNLTDDQIKKDHSWDESEQGLFNIK